MAGKWEEKSTGPLEKEYKQKMAEKDKLSPLPEKYVCLNLSQKSAIKLSAVPNLLGNSSGNCTNMFIFICSIFITSLLFHYSSISSFKPISSITSFNHSSKDSFFSRTSQAPCCFAKAWSVFTRVFGAPKTSSKSDRHFPQTTCWRRQIPFQSCR